MRVHHCTSQITQCVQEFGMVAIPLVLADVLVLGVFGHANELVLEILALCIRHGVLVSRRGDARVVWRV